MNNQDNVEAVAVGGLSITVSLVPMQRTLDEAESADDEQYWASTLHKEATVLKERGDWNGAIAKLEAAKIDMLQSRQHHSPPMWSRLAKFYQYGGRYEESMKEFDFIVADLGRRMRLEYHVDDPAFSYGKNSQSKIGMARRAIRVTFVTYERERRAVQAREARRIKKEASKKK